MASTGIVRRIDDLGRIVIPKEIRRSAGIHDNEPLEISIGEKGEIVLKKKVSTLANQIEQLMDGISWYLGDNSIQTDEIMDHLEAIQIYLSKRKEVK